MKRLSLLVLFFYTCTFVNPQASQAAVPLALVAAGAIGAGLLATSAGTYYAETGKAPSYVQATVNAAASANDYLYQSGFLAIGPLSLITAASYPQVASMYLAKNGAVGAKLGDILDYVSAHPNAFSALEDIVKASQTPAPLFTSIAVPTGGIVGLADGNKITVGNLTSTRNMNYYTDGFDSYMSSLSGYVKINGWAHAFYSSSQKQIYALSSEYCQTYNGRTYYWVYNYSATGTTSEPTLNPQTLPDYASLKDKLVNPSVDVAKDIRDVIKALPDSKLVKAGEVPTAQTAATQAPTITQAEINDILKANTAAVAQAANAASQAATAAGDAAAAVAAQTALDAAKALEDAATNDSPPPDDPEPNYPVPDTWYTKTCDLSKGLSSCINYQQILDATNSLKNTAAYQAPTFVLNCLDYVQGSGCEYPPSLSIDIFTRFSSVPLKIDLSPFQGVVSTMKFFFSLICFIMTYKSVMHLFK